MNVARFEDSFRRGADRRLAPVAHLIDDGSDLVREKLDEASDLIRGAAAQLLEDSQALIQAKLGEATELAQQARKQAKAASKEALKAASAGAEHSYEDIRRLSSGRPLVVAGVALGLGLALGLDLRARRPAQAVQNAQPKPQPAAERTARPNSASVPSRPKAPRSRRNGKAEPAVPTH